MSRWKEIWGRAIAVWLAVMAVEFVPGTLRRIFLRPRVGDFRSGQIGVFTGSVLFLVIVYVSEPWMALRGFADCLRVGLLGVVLTLALRVEFRALRGGAFVGKHCRGVHLIARGTDAGWVGHFCDGAPWIAWRLRQASANH